jgi:16S rRNA (guanine(527)-N(7))-methyltransferase RsmG
VSYRELLESELEIFQIKLRDTQKMALATYCQELEKWNKKLNLTSLGGSALVRRLIAEPVWIAQELALSGSLADIGSGNGSPGIPFEIVCSFRHCHLIEARLKRAAFLRHLVKTLDLGGTVTVHRSRFEDVATSLKEIQWVSLQAVGLTNKLVDSIQTIGGSTTTIVWITSPGARCGLRPFKTLQVPITGTQVFLFQLDLS